MVIFQMTMYIVTSRNNHWLVFYGVPLLICTVVLSIGGFIAMIGGHIIGIIAKVHNWGAKASEKG